MSFKENHSFINYSYALFYRVLGHYCNYYDIYDIILTIDSELEIDMNSFIIIDKATNRKMNNGIIGERFRTHALFVLDEDTTYRVNPITTKK